MEELLDKSLEDVINNETDSGWKEIQTLISDIEEKESDVLEGKSSSSSKPQTLAKKNDKMIERMDLESHTVSEGKFRKFAMQL
ncbi:hypothetical protein Anas_10604 [Armadillidium nasatum]|uniref:Uncharacterized protein n=1 Tax=Armadillidium nasatum TaxID=96803 RepID=A0A5N5TEU4_9CRUS|nr:hypothetical protein Anas_10604 [Armadillidium nasatum]